ncbi:hypothetical protein GCM10017782_18080 [Deinococcus ficus]|nr:hypothetical protein GCM10017782_18080 [Deinococcus ficus]
MTDYAPSFTAPLEVFNGSETGRLEERRRCVKSLGRGQREAVTHGLTQTCEVFYRVSISDDADIVRAPHMGEDIRP